MGSSLRLRGNGSIRDNGSFSSSTNFSSSGIGNGIGRRRSNSVNYVDRGLSQGESLSSINSSSTTVCTNCLGSMSYDSRNDIWYCNRCRHDDNNINKTTTTNTTSVATTTIGTNGNDKPVMAGGRIDSPNAEEQQPEVEHIFASGHTPTAAERRVQRSKDKEFGDVSDILPMVEKAGGYIVRQETHLPEGDSPTYDRNEWTRLNEKSYNRRTNTYYSYH
jgi:hypothetical protein